MNKEMIEKINDFLTNSPSELRNTAFTLLAISLVNVYCIIRWKLAMFCCIMSHIKQAEHVYMLHISEGALQRIKT